MRRMNGRIAVPALVGEYSWTWIRFNGNKKKKIPTAAYKKSVSKFAPLNLRDSKSFSGTIGVETWASPKTNMARLPKPRTKLPNTKRFVQPKFTDSRKPYTKPPSPRVASRDPIQSMRPAVARRLSGICQYEIAMTDAAIGRLMKNAQRQEACSTSQPPRTGPTAVVIAVKPDHVPMAWPRLFSSKDVLIIARLPGTRSAAPTP